MGVSTKLRALAVTREHPGVAALEGLKVVVLGLARQGVAVAGYLSRAGAEVTISDLRDREALADALEQLEGLPVRYELGGHPDGLLDGVDLLCLSGGVPTDAPVVLGARRRGIPLTNDAQLFLERCPAQVTGITGSAGKTTTTALVGEMCRVAALPVWVGGNIGNPLITDLDKIGPRDRVVMELSSFQLETMASSPQVAAVLNITPNHLDRHKTMEAYIAAKRNIVLHQATTDVSLLGYDDANARSLALDSPAHLVWFSLGAEVEEGAFGISDTLTLRWRGTDYEICPQNEVQLLGRHNLLNVLAACTLGQIAGVPLEKMRQVATSFTGVEHRLELVREVCGAKWYNDSIATAPERSLAALRAFESPIVLLAGGRDKDLPWDEFATEVTKRVRRLITFGEAGPMIARLVNDRDPRGRGKRSRARGGLLAGVAQTETLEEAIELAAQVARAGDVVLLSPGGTSFDAYRDFAERGDHFKELVRCL